MQIADALPQPFSGRTIFEDKPTSDKKQHQNQEPSFKSSDHRGWDPTSYLYPLAHLGLARATSLMGDVAASRKAYQDFLALWKDADADLAILIEAKKEYAALKMR